MKNGCLRLAQETIDRASIQPSPSEACMPEWTPSVPECHPVPDSSTCLGQVSSTRDYVDQMLLAALHEAQSIARAYDSKAQIIGVGYILALNLVLHFGDLLPRHAPVGPLFFAEVWGIVLMPILLFAQVLYPSRARAEKEFRRTRCGTHPLLYYIDPSGFADVKDFVRQAMKSDWTSVIAAELFKTSHVRAIKQARFRRGLTMAAVSFLVLGGEQIVASFNLT
jgi:hypothetical protein